MERLRERESQLQQRTELVQALEAGLRAQTDAQRAREAALARRQQVQTCTRAGCAGGRPPEAAHLHVGPWLCVRLRVRTHGERRGRFSRSRCRTRVNHACGLIVAACLRGAQELDAAETALRRGQEDLAQRTAAVAREQAVAATVDGAAQELRAVRQAAETEVRCGCGCV